MSCTEIGNRSFQLFICFVFISVYAPLSVSASLDPHEHCGFLNASGRKSIHWRGDEPQTRIDTGENAKVGFYNRGVRLRLTHNDYQETDKANYTVLASTDGRLVSRDTDPLWLQMGVGAGTRNPQASPCGNLRCEGGGGMNYFETLKQEDALTLVAILSEECNVKMPRVEFLGRALTRGTYWPHKQTIRVAPETQPWIIVHEFAHYLNHLENGIGGRIVSNNHEPHSQDFYYKLRRVARLMGGDYPWHREYKQVARWAKADAAACTETEGKL